MKPRLRFIAYANTILVVCAAIYFFLIPAGILIRALSDPGLATGTMPRLAFRWHRSLSRKFESWARSRALSDRATQLTVSDISGTEWPLFGSVFYLWSTEALQGAWKADPRLAAVMPTQQARGAIERAAALIADPKQAKWVKDHWGEDYLHHENLFYRMLLISGLTSYERLLGDQKYHALLQDQVETLAGEIEQSPFGLLDDYPGQCYPVDILPAVAAIRRADAVLGTDHSAFVQRARRAFAGSRLDPLTELPAYEANSKTGEGRGSARGIGLAVMLIWAPELWPDTAAQWYGAYERQFWDQSGMLAGLREFPKDYPSASNFLIDVDAGPVIFGFGTAASAFGIGAARANGRFDQAYPLAAEALVASWPLPDGTMMVPRLLSNLADAPFVGEAALLFSFTRQPITPTDPGSSRLPGIVYLGIGIYLAIGLFLLGAAVQRLRRVTKAFTGTNSRYQMGQLLAWIALAGGGVIAIFTWSIVTGIILLLLSQFLPARCLLLKPA